MKKNTTGWMLGVIGFGLLLTVPEITWAQAANNVLRIRRVEATMVRTPVYQLQEGIRGTRTREWLEVRTEYETAPEWLNDATFTYYILLRNSRPQQGESEFNLFTGEVTYMNIARTRSGVSTVFMHPSTVERFGGIERVAVVISSQGRVLGMESNPSSKERWWERVTPRTGFVLNRLQSPFAMVDVDSYEAIKLSE
jgi:hypothetical protein